MLLPYGKERHYLSSLSISASHVLHKMANRTMTAKIINVTKTTTEWASATDIVTKGVLCVEFTDDNKVKLKVGDGAKAFADLPYASEVDFGKYSTTEQMNKAIEDATAALGNVLGGNDVALENNTEHN